MLLTLAAALLLQQQTPEQARQDLGDGLYAITGQGGTIVFSTGADGTFVVDDQFDRVAQENLGLIEEVSDGPIVFVLNTHYHGDHTGANVAFTRAGATVVATERVRERLASGNTDGAGAQEPDREAALPVITFNDAMTFHWNGETIRAVSLPDAHTDGDAMVFFEGADVLHTGDVFFSGRFPYIDVEGGGSVDGMIAALERITEVAGPQTTVVPGHGPIGNVDAVEDALSMLRTARDAVQARIEAGDTREAAVQAQPLADLAETYGWQFIDADKMTGQVYDSLTAAAESDAEDRDAAAGQPDAAAVTAPPATPAAPTLPTEEAGEAEADADEASEQSVEDRLNEAQTRGAEEAERVREAADPAPQPADPVEPTVPATTPEQAAPTPNRGG